MTPRNITLTRPCSWCHGPLTWPDFQVRGVEVFCSTTCLLCWEANPRRVRLVQVG